MRADLQKPIYSLVTAIVATILFVEFPAKEYVHAYISSFVFLILLPYLVIRFVFKDPLSKFGFIRSIKRRDAKRMISILIASVLLAILLQLIFPGIFSKNINNGISQSFFLFLTYILVLVPIPTFFYEFFFRSFIQCSWIRVLGIWSIAFQFISLLLFLFFSDNMSINILYAGIISGFIMYITRSFLLCFLFSWLFAIISSVIFIRFF